MENKISFKNTGVFAFTPKGEVVHLPRGSTVVDFAYHVHTEVRIYHVHVHVHICVMCMCRFRYTCMYMYVHTHTQVGNLMLAARVNNRLVLPSYVLSNGDVVNILCSEK